MRRPQPVEAEFAILVTLIGIPLTWGALQTLFALATAAFAYVAR